MIHNSYITKCQFNDDNTLSINFLDGTTQNYSSENEKNEIYARIKAQNATEYPLFDPPKV